MRSDPQGPLRRSFEGECQSVRFRACFIFLGLAGLQMLGCVGFAERLRQYTYPPDFHYISTEQLRSTMWQLAYHSRELNRLMTPPSSAESHRVQILDHLESMEQVIIELNRTAWPTNHPLIDKNRSNFLRDIKMAEHAIRREPPNFLLASSVTGACIYCHSGRAANE